MADPIINEPPTEDSSRSARVSIIKEVIAVPEDSEWRLCLQWCRYNYGDGTDELGYRFIWRRPDTGNLQAARGQARLPSRKLVDYLFDQATKQGWGDKTDGSSWKGIQ